MVNEKVISKNVEAEYMDIANRNAWQFVYQSIGRQCQQYRYTIIEAKKPQNKPLNRYRDVNPYDHSRIILKRCDKDYINANLVKMDRANRKYILTQGPLAFTVGHFWLMVWEQQSRAILMLNKIIEKSEIKCHWYWPQDIGEEHMLSLSDVKLTVEQISAEDFDYFTTRVFRINDVESGESREVVQFHYTTWPDFGVPTSPVAFLDFLKRVRASGALDPNCGPAVVHCSAGIGRSGTFCLVDSCLVIIEKEGMDNVDIQSILLEMRKDRMGLIQTADQLRFSYQAIIEGAKRLDPNYQKQINMNDSIYSLVADEEDEDAPPPLPPRDESLRDPGSMPPKRPLPAIPVSTSSDELNYPDISEAETSSEDEPPPLPPPRGSAVNSLHEEDGTEQFHDSVPNEPPSVVRNRQKKELTERLSAIKKRVRDAERWHALKRSLYRPLTITFGVLIAGIVFYAYVKH